MLNGRGLDCRNLGRRLGALEEPWAADLARSSAHLLGGKSMWPGVQ